MKSEQLEHLKLQTSAEKEDSNRENSSFELVERDQINGSPFWIVGNKVDGYFLAFGKYRMGDVFYTKEEVVNYLENSKWDIVGYYAGIIAELTIDEKLKNLEIK